MSNFMALTVLEGDKKCFVKADEVIVIGQFIGEGTTLVLKNEERDILVKETPEQVMEILRLYL